MGGPRRPIVLDDHRDTSVGAVLRLRLVCDNDCEQQTYTSEQVFEQRIHVLAGEIVVEALLEDLIEAVGVRLGAVAPEEMLLSACVSPKLRYAEIQQLCLPGPWLG